MCWGGDFIQKKGKWTLTVGGGGLKNPYKIRQNAYRVLLSRGREGMFIYVPKEQQMDETYIYLNKCLGKN